MRASTATWFDACCDCLTYDMCKYGACIFVFLVDDVAPVLGPPHGCFVVMCFEVVLLYLCVRTWFLPTTRMVCVCVCFFVFVGSFVGRLSVVTELRSRTCTPYR